jgi:hypothetical protein
MQYTSWPLSPLSLILCGRWAGWFLPLLWGCAAGCAALTNPVADGVPVRHLPPELLGKSRDVEVTIPLSLLEQKPPDVYRLAPGDVLGIWIEGVFPVGPTKGDLPSTPPPINVAPPVQIRDQRRLPPGIGYPVPVRENGTISLPSVPSLSVQGMTLEQLENAIRNVYIEKKIVTAENARLQVSLLQPRQTQVVVLRQEASAFIFPAEGGLTPGGKRGTGYQVDLAGYENDVLHALTQTGGLPGLDDYNEILIFPACSLGKAAGAAVLHELETRLKAPAKAGASHELPPGILDSQVVRIPLRLPPGQPPPFRPEDVVLHTGDVVFLEARDKEVFYTGGLLPAAEHILPRDRELDVLGAVAQARGTLFNGAFNTNNLSGNLLAPGIGNPSPSLLVVLRRTHGGGQVPIKVDLRRALCDARERIPVQAGDVLILQEMPSEALARYFSETFLNFSLAWQAVHSRFATGVVDVTAPQQLPAGRIQVIAPAVP